MPYQEKEISSLIHQAALELHGNLESLCEICDACNHFSFAGLCTNLIRIPAARKRLGKKKSTKLIALIGFPFGDIPDFIKIKEAEWAAEHGADELEMVPNFLRLSEGAIEEFAEEIDQITSIGLPTRVILETMTIPQEKLRLAIEGCLDAGARGIQTGNGFGLKANKTNIVELNSLIKKRCEIKAVGGIKDLSHALDLIEAGASFIGTSSGMQLANQSKVFNE